MKVVIIDHENSRLNKVVDVFMYIFCYTIVLIAVALLFKSFYIDNAWYGFWALLAASIIYVLNKTIKPVLFLLTLPITGLTLGLFYPFINVFILKMVDFILMEHFAVKGLFMPFFIAVVISIMNGLMEFLVIKPLTRNGARRG